MQPAYSMKYTHGCEIEHNHKHKLISVFDSVNVFLLWTLKMANSPNSETNKLKYFYFQKQK